MADIAIRVDKLGKRYVLGRDYRLPKTVLGKLKRAAASPFDWLTLQIRGPRPEQVLWALRDISFEVGVGEMVGVIGRNGAGKSTLLKLLSRITEPTEGGAEIRGRIGSLLEVGTGMHPDLTGRENVYMNATILGMTKKEVDRKFDEIVDFSGVGRFLDTQVKRFSSGMRVRLGFAIAAHLEPEILVVDEVLAVGDTEFQRKCLAKMQDVSTHGRTILFVSHNMASIKQLCPRSILLEDGRVAFDGDTRTAVEQYLGQFSAHRATVLSLLQTSTDEIEFTEILLNQSESDVVVIPSDCQSLDIELHATTQRATRISIAVRLRDDLDRCWAFYTPQQYRNLPPVTGPGDVVVRESIQLPPVNRGRCTLQLVVYTEDPSEPIARIRHGLMIQFEGTPAETGMIYDQNTASHGWIPLRRSN